MIKKISISIQADVIEEDLCKNMVRKVVDNLFTSNLNDDDLEETIINGLDDD